MKERMLYKSLVVCVIVLFIGMGIQPAFANDNININNANQILNRLEYKETVRSNEVHLYCVGRIDNLTTNETKYAFDCINVRLYLRCYYEGLLIMNYIHHKMSNTFYLLIEGESWEIRYTHYYYKDFTRFHIDHCNFSGILKPSYIIGTFSISLNNTTSLVNKELLENNKLKCKDESLNLDLDIVYRQFFMGNITDLEVGDDYYYFNTTNIFRIKYIKIENSFWERVIERDIDKKCAYHIGGTRFRGILKSDYICGFFIYP